MNIDQLEKEALHLSEDQRAKLAQKLLISLDEPNEDENAKEWLEAARQRAKDIDNGLVQPVSAEEVRRKALSILRCFIFFIRQQKQNTWNPLHFMNPSRQVWEHHSSQSLNPK